MSRQPSQDLVPPQRIAQVLGQLSREVTMSEDPRQARMLGLKADVLRDLAKKTKQSVEVINQAVVVKLRALRHMAKLMEQLKRDGVWQHGGDRRSNAQAERLKISDLGIDRGDIYRARLLLNLEHSQFEECLERGHASGCEMSTASFLRLARRVSQNGKPRKTDCKKSPETNRQALSHRPTELDDCLEELRCRSELLANLLRPVYDEDDGNCLQRSEREHIRRLVVEILRILEQAAAHAGSSRLLER